MALIMLVDDINNRTWICPLDYFDGKVPKINQILNFDNNRYQVIDPNSLTPAQKIHWSDLEPGFIDHHLHVKLIEN